MTIELTLKELTYIRAVLDLYERCYDQNLLPTVVPMLKVPDRKKLRERLSAAAEPFKVSSNDVK